METVMSRISGHVAGAYEGGGGSGALSGSTD